MELLKGTKVYSIFTGTCPVCQNESMYLEANPYKISKTLKMKERCGHCHTKYKIEPSFFYGAMYVSYPVGLTFASVALFLCFFIFDMDLLNTFFVIVIEMILVLPIVLRLSRNIWINFFMHYGEHLKTKQRA
ncbi:DUF983 domain-containing protein [Zobellia russellii]|uniref:DUF983 domain-containing protein n=1 Tax=Zobellia russellii TaxID=248907 RepID=UPI0037DD4327